MKKLIPAIVMLLVSAVVLSTASYAWFTTSEAVDVQGMSVTAQAPTSVLISGYAYTAPAGGVGEGTWAWTPYASSVNLNAPESRLYAASSLTGETFFAPAQCEDTTGAMVNGTNITTKGASDNVYVDYNFKVLNTSSEADAQISVTNLATTVTNNIANAVRVAVIVKATASADAVTYYIFNPKGNTEYVKVFQADGSKVDALGAIKEEYTGAVGEDFVTIAKGEAPSFTTQGTALFTAPKMPVGQDADDLMNAPNAVEVTVRVWFEGQSAYCITKNAGMSTGLKFTFDLVN